DFRPVKMRPAAVEPCQHEPVRKTEHGGTPHGRPAFENHRLAATASSSASAYAARMASRTPSGAVVVDDGTRYSASRSKEWSIRPAFSGLVAACALSTDAFR